MLINYKTKEDKIITQETLGIILFQKRTTIPQLLYEAVDNIIKNPREPSTEIENQVKNNKKKEVNNQQSINRRK